MKCLPVKTYQPNISLEPCPWLFHHFIILVELNEFYFCQKQNHITPTADCILTQKKKTGFLFTSESESKRLKMIPLKFIWHATDYVFLTWNRLESTKIYRHKQAFLRFLGCINFNEAKIVILFWTTHFSKSVPHFMAILSHFNLRLCIFLSYLSLFCVMTYNFQLEFIKSELRTTNKSNTQTQHYKKKKCGSILSLLVQNINYNCRQLAFSCVLFFSSFACVMHELHRLIGSQMLG